MRGLLIAFLLSAAPGASILFAMARNDVVVDIRSDSETVYRKAKYKHRESVGRYNAEVLSSGSALSEEAKRLKADVEAMRLKSEAMRRQLDQMGPLRARGGPIRSPAAPTSGALSVAVDERTGQASPDDEHDRVWPALIAVAACVLLFIFLLDRYGPKVRLRRPQVICPGCGKRLRVPRSRKRVRIRCPSCRRESAYNPQKKPRKR